MSHAAAHRKSPPDAPPPNNPSSSFAQSARLSARRFLLRHARSVLREAAAHGLRERVRPQLVLAQRSNESSIRSRRRGSRSDDDDGDDSSSDPERENVAPPEIRVTHEDVDAAYALARRVSHKWAEKLEGEGLADAAGAVRDATEKGRFLEADDDIDDDEGGDSVGDGGALGGDGGGKEKGSARDGAVTPAAEAGIAGGEREARRSSPSSAPTDENEATSSSRRFMTAYAELCHLGYDPLPASSPNQYPAPHPCFQSGGKNTEAMREWFRSQIDVIDAMAADGRTMWPFDWKVVEDAARESVRRLHVNPTARRPAWQQHEEEKGRKHGASSSGGGGEPFSATAALEGEGSEGSGSRLTSRFVERMLERKRARRERVAAVAAEASTKREEDEEGDTTFASAPLPPLSRPASDELPPSGEVSWSYELEVAGSMPALERDGLIREMIHEDYWPEDMRRSGEDEGNGGGKGAAAAASSSPPPRHPTVQGALKRLAAVHQWEQRRAAKRRIGGGFGNGTLSNGSTVPPKDAQEADSRGAPSKAEVKRRRTRYTNTRKERLGPGVEEIKSGVSQEEREAKLKGGKVVRSTSVIGDNRGTGELPFDVGDSGRGPERLDLDLGECILEVEKEEDGSSRRVSYAFRSLEVTLLEAHAEGEHFDDTNRNRNSALV